MRYAVPPLDAGYWLFGERLPVVLAQQLLQGELRQLVVFEQRNLWDIES